MSDVEPAVIVKDLYKSFKLPHEQHSGIKQRIINIFKGVKGYETQKVLKDISFEIKKGEFFGIVGRNGSGKSTLLKLIAGIYTPNKGAIQINGSLTPFIELGVGFNPELTGRENVFLNGALLGFSKSEVDAMYDDIIGFAELEKFMDQKLKNYSSGMQVRLAFSIAIRARSDILLLDEVLAVGDEVFQRKCYNYFAELKRAGKTVILVTHDMMAVQRFCSRAMLIDKGKVGYLGSPGKTADIYSKLNEAPIDLDGGETRKEKQPYGDALIKTTIRNEDDIETSTFNPKNKIKVVLDIKILHDIQNPVVGITIEKSDSQTIYAVSTEAPEKELPATLNKGDNFEIIYDIDNVFGEDIYTIDSAIVSKDRTLTYFREDGAGKFKVQNWGNRGWLLHPKTNVKIIER